MSVPPQMQQGGGHHQQQQVDQSGEPEALRNLMVNYIPTTIDEVQLRQIFEMYGPVNTVKIVNDRETRTSKGYGFVKYNHAFSAAHAIQYLNGYPLLNKRLKVAYANQADAQRILATGMGGGFPLMGAAAAAGGAPLGGGAALQQQQQGGVDAAAQMQYMQQLAALQLLQQQQQQAQLQQAQAQAQQQGAGGRSFGGQ